MGAPSLPPRRVHLDPGAYFAIGSKDHSFPFPSVLTRTRSQPGPCRERSSFLSPSDKVSRFQTRKRRTETG